MAEMIEHLQKHNPEFLDMAARCAADLGTPAKAMVGFSMFYRLLMAQSLAGAGTRTLTLLPRVSAETRDLLVAHIDRGTGRAQSRASADGAQFCFGISKLPARHAGLFAPLQIACHSISS